MTPQHHPRNHPHRHRPPSARRRRLHRAAAGWPAPGLDVADPFLLLDEMGPVDYGPGRAVARPSHPHRRLEPVTYMLEGRVRARGLGRHRGGASPGTCNG